MSVLIKGMAMPKEGTCNFCPLAHYHSADDVWMCHGCFVDMDGDEVFAPIDVGADGTRIRLPQCPLVEVPVPHGTLIDKEKALSEWCNKKYKPKPDYKCNYTFYLTLYYAPTVIEAEGEE